MPRFSRLDKDQPASSLTCGLDKRFLLGIHYRLNEMFPVYDSHPTARNNLTRKRKEKKKKER